jgi:hypothetical protein
MLPHVTAPACRPTTPTPQRFSTKSCHGLGSRTARGVSSVDFVTTTRAVSRVVWTGSVVTLRCLVVVSPCYPAVWGALVQEMQGTNNTCWRIIFRCARTDPTHTVVDPLVESDEISRQSTRREALGRRGRR